ncbi:hypothetical protein WJX72_004332 [[Myrmecia] bisecta]|uniref:cGMP-dependent protein kinase n=1 Tax=[Myrmecia] bisecta TaxID=41462 RepID=A0AAW1PWI2_9CHLO
MGCTTSAPVDESNPGKLSNKPQNAVVTGGERLATGEIRVHPGVKTGLNTTKQEGVTAVVQNAGPKSQPLSAKLGTDISPLSPTNKKERRLGFGSEVVRDQLRKLAVGGPQPAGDQPSFYEVSDSSDEELNKEETITTKYSRQSSVLIPKQPEAIEKICQALETSFVFKGINRDILHQVVSRMFIIELEKGCVILEQGALPQKDDCLYFLEQGEVDVVISGGGTGEAPGHEERKVEGNQTKIHKMPGWVFGDVALLFNSPRSASVVAATDITLWAMDNRTFMKFVMKHAPGARALRFVRKLPLLKGLSDNVLIMVAARMAEEVYQDGQALIKYGERGDKLYLIRYGKVRVLRPDDKGGRVEVAVLGRGHFVGERTLITGKLRSADCVAHGRVQVVVMNKKDFLDLDNPLLGWMLDYDAVATVLKSTQTLNQLPQDQLEAVIDRFEREDFSQGDVIVKEGEVASKLYILKMGDLVCTRAGTSGPVNGISEAGGFSFFGERSLQANEASAVTITVHSEKAVLLSFSRRALLQLMGQDTVGAVVGLSADDIAAAAAALRRCPGFMVLTDSEVKGLAGAFELREYGEGDVVAYAGDAADRMYVMKSGECLITQNKLLTESGEAKVATLSGLEGQRLCVGEVHGEQALLAASTRTTSIVAIKDATLVMTITHTAAEHELGCAMQPLLQQRAIAQRKAQAKALPKQEPVEFSDLLLHRIIGTGQFGSVRMVSHQKTHEIYALKVMHKAPIVESKQVEHVINERHILEEAAHQFCVRLVRAYQDKASLYLLQEWVPGGELFHHLDLEGAFDEPTAMFYAANVLLALEHLHARGIVYRDLKPENLLLDKDGYIKVADFGFAKKIGNEKTYTICGTPDYQAPEVIMRRGTGKAADYWALGVLIFEMLVGDPPFKSLSGDPWDTFRRTLSGRFYVPNFISDSAADLIYKLLQVVPERRLGSGSAGADEIKRHKWFQRLDWEALEDKRLPAPIKVTLARPNDTHNFDQFDNVDPPAMPNRVDKNAHMWDLWDWIDDVPQLAADAR